MPATRYVCAMLGAISIAAHRRRRLSLRDREKKIVFGFLFFVDSFIAIRLVRRD